MAARDYQITITAAAQQLSVAIPTDPSRGGTRDEAYRQIILSTETDCFIGSTSSLTTSNYGYKLLAPTAAFTSNLVIGPFETGPVKLSDLWVIGTSGKLHILGIPF